MGTGQKESETGIEGRILADMPTSGRLPEIGTPKAAYLQARGIVNEKPVACLYLGRILGACLGWPKVHHGEWPRHNFVRCTGFDNTHSPIKA